LLLFLADGRGVPVVRPTFLATPDLGAVFLGGLRVVLWMSGYDFGGLWLVARRFAPGLAGGWRVVLMGRGRGAVARSRKWSTA
jgi:glycerol kinase